ncbi:D-aminopeptidase [Streptosporangium roseum]
MCDTGDAYAQVGTVVIMKTSVRKILAAVLAAGAVAGFQMPAGAEPAPRPRIEPHDVEELVDRIVPAQLAGDRIPGAAVAVVADGRTVLAKGYGVADVTTGRPVDASRTGFFTGSMSKLLTTTAVLQLVERGRLDLRADVNRYLTAFKIKDTYPGQPVTVEHLLTYTAGFDDDIVGLATTDPRAVAPLGRSVADRQPRRVRPPGTRVAYNNYGLALAGHLVEIASGQPFAHYVDQRVLKPLGMDSTTVAVPHPAAIDAALARGHRPAGDGHTVEKALYGPWTPTGTGPATTAADMARFMLAQLRNDPRLGRNVARLMQRQHHTQDTRMPGMGYTFEQRPRNGRWLVYKDGDVPGFHNVMALLPDEGVGIYVVYNGDGVDTVAPWDGNALVNQIVDRYLPDTGRRTHGTAGGEVSRPDRARDAAAGEVSAFAGTYRSARTSQTSLLKVAALSAAPTVSANADGTLTTTGLSPDPARRTQHWIRIQAGLFAERDGQDRIAFDGKGVLSTSANPAETLEKLAWYDSPAPHLGLLGAGALALVLAFLGFPLLAAVRILGRRPRHTPGARAARSLAWITGALVTAFLTGFAVVMADPATVLLDSPWPAALQVTAAVALVSAILVSAAAVAAWWKGWWGWAGRLSYTLVALGGAGFFTVAVSYNLVALPFSAG